MELMRRIEAGESVGEILEMPAEVKWKRNTPTTRKPTKLSTPRLVSSRTPNTSR